MRASRFILMTALLAETLIAAQRGRRDSHRTAGQTGADRLPAVTFNGALKELTAKTVVISSDDGQPVTIYRNRKTRFLKADNPIDPKQIEPGTKLTIDVTKNPDASLLAVTVIVAGILTKN